jgi:ATP-dependent Clp protease adapter protein ClpS
VRASYASFPVIGRRLAPFAMQDVPATINDVHVELLNDEQTPFEFVVTTLVSVFGKDINDAQSIANVVHRKGLARLGPYASPVATTMVDLAVRRAKEAGHPLQLRLGDLGDSNDVALCNFCGLSSADSSFLYQGRGAYICDTCVIGCAKALHAATPSTVIRNVYQLLDWHFGGVAESDVVSVERSFPLRMRADLQHALNEVLTREDVRMVGIHGVTSYEPTTFSSLFAERRHPKTIGSLQYEEVDVGDDTPVRCLSNALWLFREEELPMAVMLTRRPQHDSPGLVITVAAPAGSEGQLFADKLFLSLEKAVAEAKSYRGKVLSLDAGDHYRGFASGISVHQLPPISRDDVVLPEETVRLIERNVVGFARLRPQLIALGQSGKKGLLFHGPPGTGKTHTVRYLAGCLPDHTTLLVTAGQVGLIGDYFALARLLQPAILVIEDADLIARNRENMGSSCEEVLLNELLNEMDGLKSDAAIFVILTTNRPQVLEAALAQRPGRIDQAIAFPAPDLASRLKLIALYRGNLVIADQLAESMAKRIEGVSGAFIKELMRRLAQSVIDRGLDGAVCASDVDEALGELALGNDRLTQALLGLGGDTP